MPYPNSYRCPYGKPAESCCTECATFLETRAFQEASSIPAEVAAVFIEPIQGEGGYVPAPMEFLQELQQHLPQVRHPARRRRSAVRHGPHRQVVGRRITAGLEPDILCIAKGIASRHAAFGAPSLRASIMDWTPGAHASTFGGNPGQHRRGPGHLEAARNAVHRKRAPHRRIPDGPHGRTGANDITIVGDVRGNGLMIGIEIVRTRRPRSRGRRLRDGVVDSAFQQGPADSRAPARTPSASARPWSSIASRPTSPLNVLAESLREAGKIAVDSCLRRVGARQLPPMRKPQREVVRSASPR